MLKTLSFKRPQEMLTAFLKCKQKKYKNVCRDLKVKNTKKHKANYD